MALFTKCILPLLPVPLCVTFHLPETEKQAQVLYSHEANPNIDHISKSVISGPVVFKHKQRQRTSYIIAFPTSSLDFKLMAL